MIVLELDTNKVVEFILVERVSVREVVEDYADKG